MFLRSVIMMVDAHLKIALIALEKSLNALQGAQTVIVISDRINVALHAYPSRLKSPKNLST